MALARALRQLTPTLASQLLPSSTQPSLWCGLHHQQLPSACVSLANLLTTNQLHHSSLISQEHHGFLPRSSGEAWDHQKDIAFLQVNTWQKHRTVQGEKCQGHNAHQQVSQLLNLRHMRHYSSKCEQADKPQYPITTPEHVYVYNGPLAVTVTRLKVQELLAVCNSATWIKISLACRN